MTSTVSFPSHKATYKLEGQGDKSHSEQLEGSEQESHIAQPPSLVDAATHIQGAASLLSSQRLLEVWLSQSPKYFSVYSNGEPRLTMAMVRDRAQ